MDRYSGATCPFCGKPFFEGDDVVVCPDCGAPHHRACWKEHGACAFSARHAEAYSWQEPGAKPDVREEAKGAEAAAADRKLCARCGSENPPDCDYCESCGAPLHTDGALFGQYDAVPDDEEINGVAAKELSVYVGDNAGYFLPRFKMFSEGRSADWNWSAFFFTYFYLYYRKMYLYATLVLVSTLVLSLPSMALSLEYCQEMMINNGLLDEMFFTLSNQEAAVSFSNFADILMLLMRGFILMFTNKMYYTHAMDDIHRINGGEAGNDGSRILRLAEGGGTSRTMVIAVAAGLFLLYMALTFALAFLFAAQ